MNRKIQMTTYDSYEEAKIANPECDIYSNASGNQFQSNSDGLFFIKCKPEFHCVTVEKFLSDGDKFADGDLYINGEGLVKTVGEKGHRKPSCNDVRNIYNSHNAYILRAAALNKPKRTKVEYVKVEDTGFFELKDEFQGRQIFFNQSVVSTPDYEIAMDIIELSHHYSNKNLYRRIETEITERDEFIEAYGKVRNEFANQGAVVDFCEFMYDSGKFKLVN